MTKAATAQKDIFDEMTRDELLDWMRRQFFYKRPRRSEILFMRWQRQSRELMAERDKENRSLDGVDFAERDRLARQCNETKDPEQKLKLLKKIAPYDNALSEHIARSKKLDKRQEKVDWLYKRYEAEHKKEADHG